MSPNLNNTRTSHQVKRDALETQNLTVVIIRSRPQTLTKGNAQINMQQKQGSKNSRVLINTLIVSDCPNNPKNHQTSHQLEVVNLGGFMKILKYMTKVFHKHSSIFLHKAVTKLAPNIFNKVTPKKDTCFNVFS